MILSRCFKCLTDIRENLRFSCRVIHYVQGQSPESRVREYFYYVDHQGQVGHLLVAMLQCTFCVVFQTCYCYCRPC